MRFVAPTTRGAEGVLAAELEALGLKTRQAPGAVIFAGDLSAGYRACLWTRIASRILVVVGVTDAEHPDDLYDGVFAIDWGEHMGPDQTLAVDFVGTSPTIRSSRFGALRVKDAIVDKVRDQFGRRPNIDLKHPDLRVHTYLRNGQATISIDLAGVPLHKRGYGRIRGGAPLRESLAAAMLHLADWPAKAKEGLPFCDPMCGSGTILEEAAAIALDRAPGLTRRYDWGFDGWSCHEPSLWSAEVKEARARAKEAQTDCRFYGFDNDRKAVERARQNADLASLAEHITIEEADFATLESPGDTPGIVMMNPPYGERIGANSEMALLYAGLGDGLRRRWLGWHAWVLAGSVELAKRVGLKPAKRLILHNGPIECRLLSLPISDKPVARDVEGDGPRG